MIGREDIAGGADERAGASAADVIGAAATRQRDRARAELHGERRQLLGGHPDHRRLIDIHLTDDGIGNIAAGRAGRGGQHRGLSQARPERERSQAHREQ